MSREGLSSLELEPKPELDPSPEPEPFSHLRSWERVCKDIWAPPSLLDLSFGMSDGLWVFSWPPPRSTLQKKHQVSCFSEDSIRKKSPTFATACDGFVADLGVNALPFLLAVFYTCSETELKKQRYIVYRQLAIVTGWRERKRFPEDLEKAVQTIWEQEGETHIRYVP